nr:protein hothead [Quercus suber]
MQLTDQPLTVPTKATAEAAEIINAIAKESFKGGVIVEKVTGHLSTGYLELRNTNPNDNPAVTFNYFKELEDLMRCVLGMRTVIEVNAYPFSKFRYNNMTMQALIDMMVSLQLNKRPRHPSAAYSLEQFCIDTVMTIWHYHGGCQVGKVVDHDYKKKEKSSGLSSSSAQEHSVRTGTLSFKEVLLHANMEAMDTCSTEVGDEWTTDPTKDASDLLDLTIHLPPHVREKIYAPWKNSLIVKVVGKSFGYKALFSCLTSIWRPKGYFSLIDLGYEFFLVKFTQLTDYLTAFEKGPWFVGEHYLFVHKQELEFQPAKAKATSLVAWIRFSTLVDLAEDSLNMEAGESDTLMVPPALVTTSADPDTSATTLSPLGNSNPCNSSTISGSSLPSNTYCPTSTLSCTSSSLCDGALVHTPLLPRLKLSSIFTFPPPPEF